MAACEPIEGNPDFYGLGIRIGIYLQWSSAWLNLLLDPESAQSVLDTNSVFVFAVVIATIIADQRDAPPIEIYILLQILLGFPITTLSSFGIRLWLMTPSRLKKLLDTLCEEWSKYQERVKQTFKRAPPDTAPRDRETTRTASDEREGAPGSQTLAQQWAKWAQKTLEQGQSQASTTAALPYNVLSALKFPGLSWSGVAWRTATVSMVAVFNEVYWFSSVFDPSEDTEPPECGPPFVFLFSKQPLEGPIVSLGKAAGIIIVGLTVPPAYTLLAIMLQIFWFGYVILLRDAMKLWGPTIPNSLGSSMRRINHILEANALPVLRSLQYYSHVLPTNTLALEVAQSFFDLLVFISTSPGESDIRFSDVLKFLISLGIGKPSMPTPRHGDAAALPAPAVRAATTMSEWENRRYVERGVIYRQAVWNVHLLTFKFIGWAAPWLACVQDSASRGTSTPS